MKRSRGVDIAGDRLKGLENRLIEKGCKLGTHVCLKGMWRKVKDFVKEINSRLEKQQALF